MFPQAGLSTVADCSRSESMVLNPLEAQSLYGLIPIQAALPSFYKQVQYFEK